MDANIISGLVDIAIALIGFGGGIGVALVTQKHTDDRHDKDIDAKKGEDVYKHIEKVESDYKGEISKIRTDAKVCFDNIDNQMTELKDLFSEMRALYQQSQAVTEIKIERLTDECRKHNGVIERTFHLEERMSVVEEKQSVANNRIADLERHEESNKNGN